MIGRLTATNGTTHGAIDELNNIIAHCSRIVRLFGGELSWWSCQTVLSMFAEFAIFFPPI